MFGEVAHRHVELLALGRASAKLLLAREGIAQPSARDEVERRLLVSRKVSVEREKDEGVLLRVLPTPLRSVREKAARDLGNQIVCGLVCDERFEDDAVGASVRVEQKVIVVRIARREVRSARGLFGAVVEQASNRSDFHRGVRIARKNGQKPADGFERELVESFRGDETARARSV